MAPYSQKEIMRIKMKTLYASSTKTIQIDEVGEFSDKEGQALVDGKYGISLEPIEIKEIKLSIAPIKKEKRPKNIKKKGKK